MVERDRGVKVRMNGHKQSAVAELNAAEVIVARLDYLSPGEAAKAFTGKTGWPETVAGIQRRRSVVAFKLGQRSASEASSIKPQK